VEVSSIIMLLEGEDAQTLAVYFQGFLEAHELTKALKRKGLALAIVASVSFAGDEGEGEEEAAAVEVKAFEKSEIFLYAVCGSAGALILLCICLCRSKIQQVCGYVLFCKCCRASGSKRHQAASNKVNPSSADEDDFRFEPKPDEGAAIPCPAHVAFKWEQAGPLGDVVAGPNKEEQIENEAKTLFEHMDADANGFLSTAELEKGLIEQFGFTQSEVLSLMNAADINADGKLSYAEYRCGVVPLLRERLGSVANEPGPANEDSMLAEEEEVAAAQGEDERDVVFGHPPAAEPIKAEAALDPPPAAPEPLPAPAPPQEEKKEEKEEEPPAPAPPQEEKKEEKEEEPQEVSVCALFRV